MAASRLISKNSGLVLPSMNKNYSSRLAFIWLLLLSTFNTSAAERAWATYVSERFGYSLSYPPALKAGRRATDGAGIEFLTTDQKFTVTTGAGFLRIADPTENEDQWWQDELVSYNSTRTEITHREKRHSWYAIGGNLTNGYAFYKKAFFQGNNFAMFEITFPRAETLKYKAWVPLIEKGFRPFLPGKQYDRPTWKGASTAPATNSGTR